MFQARPKVRPKVLPSFSVRSLKHLHQHEEKLVVLGLRRYSTFVWRTSLFTWMDLSHMSRLPSREETCVMRAYVLFEQVRHQDPEE